MKRLILFLAAVAVALPAAAEEFRTWTSANGKHTIEARFTKAEHGNVTLTTEAGKTITVKAADLPPVTRMSSTASMKGR